MTTLNEIAQLLGFDEKRQNDFHVWGKVVSVSGNKATVSLNASQVNVECTKCVPCNVNDRIYAHPSSIVGAPFVCPAVYRLPKPVIPK